ncbi:MAG: hypothetical protein EOM35_02345 [Negativicutes bacterium]|nr:hypothetical protein [Negativicutes bacterium]
MSDIILTSIVVGLLSFYFGLFIAVRIIGPRRHEDYLEAFDKGYIKAVKDHSEKGFFTSYRRE